MGQGFFGYNPPKFILDAAKEALDRVDCNQYSPTKGRPRLKKAIADSYTPFWGRTIDPETEVTITTGANEGMLSAFMAFLEEGDEVIIFEPFFDQYVGERKQDGREMVGGRLTNGTGTFRIFRCRVARLSMCRCTHRPRARRRRHRRRTGRWTLMSWSRRLRPRPR